MSENESQAVQGDQDVQSMGDEAQVHADGSVTLTTSRGRKITIKESDVLAEYRLVQALGPEVSANHLLVRMYMPLQYLTAIDGEPVPRPANQIQADSIISRLGREGLNLLAASPATYFKDDAEVVADAKK